MNGASQPTAASPGPGGALAVDHGSRAERRLRRALAADGPGNVAGAVRDDEPWLEGEPISRRALAASGQPGEALVTWTRAWTSRDGRWNRVVAARNRDFALVTNQRLLLWSIGFFTRRPRHCVYAQPLELVVVYDQGPNPGRRLRVTGRDVRPLIIELNSSRRTARFVGELTRRAGLARQPATGTQSPKPGPA